jgi:hypothetical protein
MDIEKRKLNRDRFLKVVDSGQKQGLWGVESVDAVLEDYTYRSSATVVHENRSYRLWANLDTGTVSAYASTIVDAAGRVLSPRDVLPYGQLAPGEPKCSLLRDSDAVARSLAKRCVHDPSWAMLIDLLRKRQEQSNTYLSDKTKVLTDASVLVRSKSPSKDDIERGLFRYYTDAGNSIEIEYRGEGVVNCDLSGVTLSQLAKIVMMLRDTHFYN